MPTNDDVNGANPTDTDANATPDITSLPETEIEKHPYVQELKKKYSAAHQDMDKTNLSKKELMAEVARLKVLAGVEEDAEPEPQEPQYVTKADLEAQAWELTHAKDVELYGDDKYKADIERGIPKDYALENAKLRLQSNPDKARIERQQSMASGSASGVRNLENADYEGFNAEEAQKWGYSKETWLKQRELKKARGTL